jgi:hypothetical protein
VDKLGTYTHNIRFHLLLFASITVDWIYLFIFIFFLQGVWLFG